MSHLAFFKDISKDDVARAGGKGASLGEMTQAGIPVPPGFVILANAIDRFLEETNLDSEITARLKEVNPEDVNSVDRISAIIRDAIHDRVVPADLQEEILQAFDTLGADLVAVRSSATAEDSSVASWAGELETYLNMTREQVLERVKLCWSSLFTPRALFYRHEKNLVDSKVSVAVVIQKMVQSEISGITFTVHPVTEDRDQMIIEAGYGLGEAIVSGQITPDSYVISKSKMEILDCNVAHQSRKLVRKSKKLNTSTDNDSNEWVEISDGDKQKLHNKQILDATKLFQQIESHYGFPCDIEWAIENDVVYITQSRPITTLHT